MWELFIGCIALAILVGIGGLLLNFGCAAIYGVLALIVSGIQWIYRKIKGE